MVPFGQLNTADHLGEAPVIERPAEAADEVSVENCQILTFTHEIDIAQGFAVTPKALHPSLPSCCRVVFRHHPGGPFGAFTTAELNISARAGTSYLGYTVGTITDNAEAAAWLRARYGVHVRLGEVRLERRYFGVGGIVSAGGKTLFDGLLERPHYISGADILYTPNLHLVRFKGAARLMMQEMEFTIAKAERGSAVIRRFDAEAFGDARVVLRRALPVTASDCQLRYMAVRYLLDPDRPASVGAETPEAA